MENGKLQNKNKIQEEEKLPLFYLSNGKSLFLKITFFCYTTYNGEITIQKIIIFKNKELCLTVIRKISIFKNKDIV